MPLRLKGLFFSKPRNVVCTPCPYNQSCGPYVECFWCKIVKTQTSSGTAVSDCYLRHTTALCIHLRRSITELHLASNRLNQLPDSICHLKTLKVLELDHNFVAGAFTHPNTPTSSFDAEILLATCSDIQHNEEPQRVTFLAYRSISSAPWRLFDA